MVKENVLSMVEIDRLEQAALALLRGAMGGEGPYSVAIGAVIAALLNRWHHGLRDSETTIRLVFHLWSDVEGLPRRLFLPEAPVPTAETILDEAGGVDALPPESQFAVALLAHIVSYGIGGDADAWERAAPEIAAKASAREPSSQLLRNWPYYLGRTRETEGLWKYLMAEVHARFDGRGAYGEYMRHMLTYRQPGTV